MQWKDEEELVLVSLIASILFMTVLDLALGAIYTGMILSYMVFMRKPYTIQFSRDKKYFAPDVLVMAILGVMAYYMVIAVFKLPILTQSMIGFSITDISLANPVLKALIWIFFIPLAETLFFMGVVFGYIKYKSRTAGGLSFLVFGVVIALFHVLSQNMTQEILLIDIVFGAISGFFVLKYGELKQAFWIHVFANLIGVYTLGGLAWLLG